MTAADGTAMTDGATTINFDKPTLASVGLKTLSPGPYTVKWHAVTSDDNGQTDGTFSFTIVNNTGGTTSGGTTTGGTTQWWHDEWRHDLPRPASQSRAWPGC